MARKCELCGKTPMTGNNVSHSKRHTKRRFLPNLKSVRLDFDGIVKKVRICTNCLKTHLKKQRLVLN